MNGTESAETSSRNFHSRSPPARNTSRFWLERFLAVIQRQNPSVIDAAFLSQVAPSNEGKLLSQLKFLGIIDEQGKPTDILPKLNMVGEAQNDAFRQIITSSYGDLLAEVKIDRAEPDDIVNFFIRKYAFTRDKAINASKFVLYLAEKASLHFSRQLGEFLSEKQASPYEYILGGLTSAQSAQIRATALGKPKRRVEPETGREPESSKITAIITITLDKDTPKEFWDRVLALLGEKEHDLSSD